MGNFLSEGQHDIAPEVYHSDPCEEPSLSASLAAKLISGTPRHAWEASSRLNPNYEREEKRAFDIGSAAHEILLGKGGGIWIVDADSYRTKAAKEARDSAYEAGHTPLLKHEADQVEQMIRLAHRQMNESGIGNPFSGNQSEQTLIWNSDGITNRCMVDCLDQENRVAYDYKTTAGLADPEAWVRTSMNHGVDLRAAHYLDGLETVHGPGWTYRFVVQEKSSPFLLSVIELTAASLVMGRKKINRARSMWRWCLDRNSWPGWPAEIAVVEPPVYFETQWLEREVRESDYRHKHGEDILRIAYQLQAPAAE